MRRFTGLLCCAFVCLVPLGPASRASSLEDEAVEVGPGMEPPKLLTSIRTHYPAAAKDEGVGGTVVVRALIDRKGRVKKTEIVSSPDKRLAKAAVNAMTMREYAPATRDGEPVAVWWKETFEFRLNADEVARILACDPSKVEAGDPPTDTNFDPPVIARTVDPILSERMILRRQPGTVVLQCKVNVCGRVEDCKVLKSNGADFSASAIEAAQQRLYRPATKNGRPVAIQFTIRIDFRM
jgi:TonB family protein